MKVLFYRYGSICEPDIIDAFKELGHEVSQITEEITNKNIVFKKQAELVSQFLLDNPHDIVFTINFFPIVSDVCNIFKIPYISWIVDSPVMELFSKSIKNPCNRVFVFDKAQYNDIHHLNPDCIFHFPLAVNIKQKQSVIKQASSNNRRKFASDIAFVGSLYSEKCPYDELSGISPYYEGYLNALMESQLKIYGYYFVDELLTDDLIDEMKKHFPRYYTYPFENYLTDKITLSQLYIGNKITAMEREQTFKALSEKFSVDIYTASDTSSMPKINNRGLANTMTEMPLIFHGAKININTTSKAIRSGIPLRVFDILGCEGFMLTNHQNELFEFFEPGVDFDVYGSIDELIDKADYYLHHEKERLEIAHNGFEKVKNEYNYPKQLCQLLLIALSH